ncbi:cytochrome c556 [Litoreibacter ponti]|uniref:Cytochrome c556 n=1 Tax=Litoreibacter ponti TaxID=1510457 RepID=A0A2T6BPA4_9RHOB|nr:cytochrome c [Litoreibacter ponti]PTX57817.1 cytochrome c556 [Litoreibacter ponti]
MKRLILIPALVLASAAFAHQGVKDSQVLARMELMKEVAADMKVLGQMAKGQTAFDASKARTSAANLSAHATETIRLFEANATDPKSEALPAIWENFPEFTAQAQDMGAAADALKLGSDAEFRESFTALAQTCGSCHKTFRQKN